MIHEGTQDEFNATPEQLMEIHDLVVAIERRHWQQETDIRNLNNLIHVCLGTGVRYKEFGGS